jgi:hypothetical protein
MCKCSVYPVTKPNPVCSDSYTVQYLFSYLALAIVKEVRDIIAYKEEKDCHGLFGG